MSNLFPQAGSVAFEENFVGRTHEIKKATFLLSNHQNEGKLHFLNQLLRYI